MSIDRITEFQGCGCDCCQKINKQHQLCKAIVRDRDRQLKEVYTVLEEMATWAYNWLPDEAKDSGARQKYQEAFSMLALYKRDG